MSLGAFYFHCFKYFLSVKKLEIVSFSKYKDTVKLDGVVKTDSHKLLDLVEKYRNYKSRFAQNIRFDPARDNLSK